MNSSLVGFYQTKGFLFTPDYQTRQSQSGSRRCRISIKRITLIVSSADPYQRPNIILEALPPPGPHLGPQRRLHRHQLPTTCFPLCLHCGQFPPRSSLSAPGCISCHHLVAATTYNHFGLQFRVQLGMKSPNWCYWEKLYALQCSYNLVKFHHDLKKQPFKILGDIVLISSDNIEWDASSPL